jgi:glycogen debranching enzyme
MRRYGFHDEARKLVIGLIEASSFFGYQLPELFAGYSRSELGFPVQYLSANRPQAWASGSVLLGLRTLLGIEVEDGAIKVDEGLNGSIGHLKIEGLYGPDGTRTDINPD